MRLLIFSIIFLFGCTAAVCNYNMEVGLERLIHDETWLVDSACFFDDDYEAGRAYIEWFSEKLLKIGFDDYELCLSDAWYADGAVKAHLESYNDRRVEIESLLMQRVTRFRTGCGI